MTLRRTAFFPSAVAFLVAAFAFHQVGGAQQPTIVMRATSAADSVAKTFPARVTIAVRNVDEPTAALQEVTIYIRPVGADTLRASGTRRLRLNGQQHVTDSLMAGEYSVRAFRPGFSPYSLSLKAVGGCDVSIEIYLSPIFSCLLRCESTPPRSTITTCQPGRD